MQCKYHLHIYYTILFRTGDNENMAVRVQYRCNFFWLFLRHGWLNLHRTSESAGPNLMNFPEESYWQHSSFSLKVLLQAKGLQNAFTFPVRIQPAFNFPALFYWKRYKSLRFLNSIAYGKKVTAGGYIYLNWKELFMMKIIGLWASLGAGLFPAETLESTAVLWESVDPEA